MPDGKGGRRGGIYAFDISPLSIFEKFFGRARHQLPLHLQPISPLLSLPLLLLLPGPSEQIVPCHQPRFTPSFLKWHRVTWQELLTFT